MNTAAPFLISVSILVAAGCDGNAEQTTPANAPFTKPVPTTKPQAEAEPAPAPEAPTATAEQQTHEPSPPEPAVPSPGLSKKPGATFYKLATMKRGANFEDDEFRVFDTVDGSVFFTHGPWVLPVDASGSLVEDPRWLKGLDLEGHFPETMEMLLAWNVHELGGRAPDDLLMTSTAWVPFRSGPFPQRAYKWQGDEWKRVGNRNKRYWSFPDRLSAWVDGSILAHRSFGHRYAKPASEDYEPSAAETQACDNAIASARHVAVVLGPGKAPNGVDMMDKVRAIASGHLIGLREGPNGSQVGHLEYGKGDIVFRTLPGGDEAGISGLELFAPDRAYAFGSRGDGSEATAYIAEFDGKAWKELPGPDCRNDVFAVAWAPGAKLHALCDRPTAYTVYPVGTLWERDADGTWTETDFGGVEKEWVAGVVVRADGERWIATRRGAYGTVRPAKVIEVESLSKVVVRLFPDYDPMD